MGFGRTGKLFSFEHFDFVPDILTLAKGMGGGMPIGAFIASKELMNQLQFQPALGHITTFGGHPVSCAAAKASLEVLLNEHLVEQVEEKGMRFEEALKNIPVIKEIRRIGLMLGIDLKDSTLCQSALQSMFKHRLIADYFLFNPTSFRIAPPLIITREQIDQIIHTLTISLNKIIEK
jgi:acetylornithine/succinyldiaminopimelate/putrescine aminotransferase